ncbi:TPA: tRNA (adenosine(37)-N6)-threonylcarbamoyltransferase complex ATPase subunit type 1 TsaE [Candidatus Saccharibacteria bacterium]|nr:tRNA (adenosine(37)-N6)-threonylcarbamoyltransferase complex ATPase subunit type 1 TsaE [Candidatus Saccharibacteria bacterium]|tara:strand:+ start:621 stop:1058 length:438 start_codon:yes stop_codon:yes gene_type:complete
MILEAKTETELKRIGAILAASFKGGEVVQLIGDVGAGKTTFTKGLALGLSVKGDVQSPSFTISRVYDARDGLQLAHYDFYRLQDPGILTAELQEVVHDPTTITVIEWADIVEGVLPDTHVSISFTAPSETTRTITLPDSYKELFA